MSQRYLGGVITANPTTPTMTTESGVWTLEQQFQYSSTWSPKIVGNSLRFRSSASAYLSRTPASASNRTTWTWSAWVKRGALGARQTVFGGGSNATSTDHTYIEFTSSDTINVESYSSAASLFSLVTTQVFRDPSAYYHIVLAVDTTQATSSNRVKLYVNGTQVTSFGTANYPSLNYAGGVNAAAPQRVGSYPADYGPNYFDGYLTEVNFIDGQALTPSSFGAYDTTGTWQPLPYTGTYGTNGFYLTFADNSAVTAAALGKDYSGNGNNWTPNNFSLTAGTTYDWMLDSPTNWTSGTGNGVGNYAVVNPVAPSGSGGSWYTQNGNLSLVRNGGGFITGVATMGVTSGKWYWEVIPQNSGNQFTIGIAKDGYDWTTYLGSNAFGWSYEGGSGVKYTNGSSSAYGATYTTNDVIGVAFDADAGTLTFYKNNTSQGTAFTGLTSGPYYPACGVSNLNTTAVFNFGQRPFAYTPPAGFLALNTLNLPTPTITNGAQVMAATTWTGDGTNPRTITNGGNNTIGTTFKPDLVWTKARNQAYDHTLYDSVRGATNYLISNSTAAEASAANTLQAFNSNGFQVGGSNSTNSGSATYVAWQWQAGQGTTSSNTSGSITSTVSVNTTAGFSVVTFNSTSASGTSTIGHGLGVKPAMLIMKDRTQAYGWDVWNKGLGAISNTLILQSTAAVSTTRQPFTTTEPTSTVFSFNNTFYAASNDNIVVYAWAEVAGYSRFGSYTGNGSTDGPFVYCGFRPRFVMVKRTDTTGSWFLIDTSRNPSNNSPNYLLADSSTTEGTDNVLDILSNGFKHRNTSASENASGGTYIFAAFAENPFKIARAR